MIETERRFLVAKMPPGRITDRKEIAQGYLGFDPVTRIRVEVAGWTNTYTAYFCVKGPKKNGSGLELEYEIPYREGADILSLCKYRVDKTRYLYKHRAHTWEIDQFYGNLTGLTIAEVELDDINEPLDLPYWLGPEITDNFHYSNSTLALVGLPNEHGTR